MNYFQLLWKVVTNTKLLFQIISPNMDIKENLPEFFKLKLIPS